MKFAIIGIHPGLSKTELKTVIAATQSKLPLSKGDSLRYESNEAALFEADVDLADLQKRLGGTSKLGEILGTVKDAQEIQQHLLAILNDKGKDGKLKFGISVYDLGDKQRAKEIQKFMYKTGIQIKKAVKDSGKSVRLVSSNEPTLSSVVVAKNKLTTNGIEFCLFVTADEIHIGVTKTFQDFEDWSHRDYDRPARNAKSGMLPPKLARMMINLSGSDPKGSDPVVLLDPFCGSGTVLMEAAMLGFNNLIGSDINKRAIEDTETNLDWLKNQGIQLTMPKLLVTPASKLTDPLRLPLFKGESSVDLVVTEPFLGNPRDGDESESEIKNNIAELEILYIESFKTISQLMKPGATLVLVVPVHIYKNQEFTLPIESILSEFGLKAKQKPLRYMRKDQFVARNIWIFTKN